MHISAPPLKLIPNTSYISLPLNFPDFQSIFVVLVIQGREVVQYPEGTVRLVVKKTRSINTKNKTNRIKAKPS